MRSLLELIELLFGKGAISKTIGTRTNVIRIPSKNIRSVLETQLDFSKASQGQMDTFFNQVKELIPDLPKMNDSQKLNLQRNLQSYYDIKYPKTAEVFDYQSGQTVGKQGIETLKKEAGLPADVEPNSPLGQIMQRVNKARAEGKTIADMAADYGVDLKAGLKGLEEVNVPTVSSPLEKGIKTFTEEQMSSYNKLARLQDEGLVRAAARNILYSDIKGGKIPGMTLDDLDKIREPIDTFRNLYGEGALEVLDSSIPKFKEMSSAKEAEDYVRDLYKFEPKIDRPKESYTIQEMEDILKKGPPEGGPENLATGGTVGRKKHGLAYLMGL